MDDLGTQLALWVAGAAATAYIAQRKGHSTGQWFVYGLALWIVALPMAVFLKPKDQTPPEPAGRPWHRDRG